MQHMKCIIMAGGSGDRLWPLSRRKYPKQFMEIQENRSLLQETVVLNMPYCDEFIIVTNEGYEFIVEGQMQAFQGLNYRCVYEQSARNTAASICLLSMMSNPSELLYVVASDTIIEGPSYRDTVLKAMDLAKKGNLAVFGIEAREANTRFGYIRRQGDRVLEFKEKPSREQAREYIRSGEYLWNSGMFLMCAGDFVQEVKVRQPELYSRCREMMEQMKHQDSHLFGGPLWEEIPALSVEKAVFEKSSLMRVVEADFSWVDVDELEDVIPFMEKRSAKDTILQDCHNVSVVNRARKHLVVGEKLNDLMIVNTEDALYVAPKGIDSSIKDVMMNHQEQYGHYFERNRIAYRQWGNYEVLSQDNGFKVKRVTIYPGKSISTHKHNYRSEHWSIVSGRARITLDRKTEEYAVNESIYVPKGITHQVTNCTEENLVIIEVGIGETITESDMVKVEGQKTTDHAYGIESIIALEPAYKDYLWGGTTLKDLYKKKCDYDIVAESWELSAHPAGQSIISEGHYKGMLFGDYIKGIDKSALGWKCQAYEEFPILVKFIDARDRLSIQVHPDDGFALKEEGEYGKNEMWYIMDCKEGASLYCGFDHDVTEEEFKKAVQDNTLTELLKEIKVKKGDTIFIPAGTVHAIGSGILVCEVQQNSNSTYRIYDYGRKDKYGNGRELHLDKALQVMSFCRNEEVGTQVHEVVQCDGYSRQMLGQCKYFECTKLDVESCVQWTMEDSSFVAIVVVEGEGTIESEDKKLKFVAGSTFFVPAGKNRIRIDGKCQIIVTKV